MVINRNKITTNILFPFNIHCLICFLTFQLKETWSLDSDGKLEQGKFFKEKGTNYFKLNKLQLALKMYKKAIEYLEFDSGKEYLYCISFLVTVSLADVYSSSQFKVINILMTLMCLVGEIDLKLVSTPSKICGHFLWYLNFYNWKASVFS